MKARPDGAEHLSTAQAAYRRRTHKLSHGLNNGTGRGEERQTTSEYGLKKQTRFLCGIGCKENRRWPRRQAPVAEEHRPQSRGATIKPKWEGRCAA
jgi:hypothetical protein